MLVNFARLRQCRAACDRFFPLPFLLSPVLRTVRSAEHMMFIILTGSHAPIFAPPYAAVVHDIDLTPSVHNTHKPTTHTSCRKIPSIVKIRKLSSFCRRSEQGYRRVGRSPSSRRQRLSMRSTPFESIPTAKALSHILAFCRQPVP